MQDGHTNLVRQFAISPNGKKLVSVSNDAKIIVWDFESRSRLATLTHDDQHNVTSVAFSPDGRWFVTACADGTVNVWDAENYAKQAMVVGYKGNVNRIIFSPNGRWLLTATGQIQHTLWEVGSWRKAQDVTMWGVGETKVPIFSPDSHYLTDASWNIWNLKRSMALTCEFQDYDWFWAALSPDATQLVTTESSGFVSFWDVRQFWPNGHKRLIKREQAHRDRARAVGYSPDGRYVATGGETTILWDARNRTKLARFSYLERPTYLSFTPDSKSLVACYGDAQLLIWDVEAREQRFSFVGHSHPVRAIAFATSGKLLASAGDDQSIILWDIAARRKRTVLSKHRYRISALTFSSDGQELISTDLHGETIVWDTDNWHDLLHFSMPGLLESRFGYVVSLSPDQRFIATSFGVHARDDGRVVADFGNKDGLPDPNRQEYYGIGFSPDGRWLVGITPGNHIILRETANWTVYQRASANKGGKAGLISLAFSPDSLQFVTGEDQGNLRLWSVEPLCEVAVIGQHKSYIRSVAFSHDGRYIASASDDKTLKVWDVARRKLIEEVGIHTSPVLAVAFSPDDKQLVCGDFDGSVRVYTRQRSLWSWPIE